MTLACIECMTLAWFDRVYKLTKLYTKWT